MNDDSKFDLIFSLQQLLESKVVKHGENNNFRSKALSEKIGQSLESIPELEKFLDEKNKDLRKKLFAEIGRYIKFSKYEKGYTIKHLGEGDRFFYMTIYGKILKLNVVYKAIYATLKEYILYLAKLLIINEKYLYSDCIRKNQKIFNIKESIDIMVYGQNIKSFDFQEEVKKLKKLHTEIFLLNIPEEEKIKKRLHITDLLNLYNPSMEERNRYSEGEHKFCVNLPFFYIDKILDPVSFIGNLNKSHGIKNYSAYICLNNCDIFYIDKKETIDDYIYMNFHINKSDIVSNVLFKKHYLFKDSDINFLEKNYSKFFDIIKIKKGDNLIMQNSVYEGVYFILKGVLELKTKRSYNEINELKYNILNQNPNSDINESLESFRDKKRDAIMQRLLRNPQFIKQANEKKEINFGTLIDTEIVGLNDLYDKNNGIYYFSVKCISNEAELFFAPKEIVNSMLTNPDIEEKITKITIEKIKILKLKIKRFTDLFEYEFDKLAPSINEEKKYLISNNLNIDNNKLNINKNNNKKKLLFKLIPSNYNYKFIKHNYKINKLTRSQSDIKIFNTNNTNSLNNRYINSDEKNSNSNLKLQTNRDIIIFKNHSRNYNESKFDKFDVIKNIYSFRVNNLLPDNNSNKNIFHSSSLIDIKPKKLDNNIFLSNINDIKKKGFNNFINNYLSNKQFTDLGRNKKMTKSSIYNFYPTKRLNKIHNHTLIMPILTKNYNNHFTFQKN